MTAHEGMMKTLFGPGFARGPVQWPPATLGGPSTSVMDTAMTAGRFELHPSGTGSFRFVLKAGNHQVILTSQSYASHAAALGGIESVRTNAALPERFDRRESKAGEPYFVLKAGNGQIIGQSEMYSSAAGMENGILSVSRNAPEADLKDLSAS
ncbi:MAG: hypothetical protein RL654_628 [Pseudomonadota bacterium]|jgi:uncharacterized protein YegP (UPF0339 family)